MVERLKMAIQRAREKRAEAPAPAEPRNPPPGDEAAWSRLEPHEIDTERLHRERIITPGKSDASYAAFDMLRTRLVKMAVSQGKRHIGITSPTKGCGKTVVSANLAFSFARNPENALLLMDFDMRSPRLSRILGLRDRRSIRWLLDGSAAPDDYMLRAGVRFALGLSAEVIHESAELLQSAECHQALQRLDRMFSPDICLYDLPPMLIGDETISMMPSLDGILIVAAAGHTTPGQIEECESLLEQEDKLIGVLLNKAKGDAASSYYYNYGYGYGLDD